MNHIMYFWKISRSILLFKFECFQLITLMEQNYLENQHRVESFLKFHKTQEEVSKKGWNEPQEEIKQNIADSSQISNNESKDPDLNVDQTPKNE